MVICYVEDMKRTLADHLADVWLILLISGIRRAPYLLRREAYRQKVRPKEPFFYVWFLGVDRAHRGTSCIRELREKIFSEAAIHGLPILLETTIEQNRRVYERYGFQVYHQVQFHAHIPTMYYMRREV